ncbi:hypothetical protein QJQ45_004185 [Haematococcus lacustris]|nr:hypothetical protein QJQ45_004185 [Haematococcus lacustris]
MLPGAPSGGTAWPGDAVTGDAVETTAVNYRAIIYARVAAAVRGCSFSLAAEVHTPKDLQRLLPYLGAKFMSGLVHALLHRGTCDQLEAFRSNQPACDASGMERPLSAGARRRGKAANSAPGAVWCLALRDFGGSDRLCSIRLSFTRLPGIGPMKAAMWWRLGCHTYDQLEDHLQRVLPPADAVNEDSQLQHGQRTPAGHGAHPADRTSAPEPDSSDVAMVGDPPQHHGRPGTCSPSASYDNFQSTQQLNMEGDQASGETRGTQPARRRKHLPSDKHRRTRRRTTSHGSDRDSDARDADAPEPAWDDDASVGVASPTQEALFSVQVRDDLLAPVSELDVQQMREMLGKAIEDVTGQPGWRLEVVGGGRRQVLSHLPAINPFIRATPEVAVHYWLVTHHTTSTEGVVLPLYRHLVARGLLVPREQGFCRIQSGMGDCLRLVKQSALRGDWQESQQMDRYDHIFGLWITPVDNQGRRRYKRMDIILVPVNSWPWALMGWTGSRQYLRFLRDTAHHKQAVPEDPDFDIVDRDEAGQPDLTEAQRKREASGAARAARSRDNTFHARKAKLAHLIDHLPQALWDAFLGKAVRPRVKSISERGVIGSLLLGFLVRDLFTLHVADQLDAQGQPLSYTDTDIPVSAADIPNLNCRNLYLQLCRGLPGEGENTQPSAAVAAVLAAHPDLCARLEAIPRHLSDANMVDQVGKQLETAFSNILILLFAGRLKKSVSLAGAKVLLGTNEHQRRFGVRGLVGGYLPAWSKRQCTYVRRMVCGLEVTWLVGEGGVVVTAAMQAEVALQRGLLGLEEGEEGDDDWVEDPANRGRLLRHAVHTTREMEAAMAAWQLDMVPWQQAELTNPGLLPRPPRPPTPYAITPTSKCRARHIFIDTNVLYGLMSDAGMLGVLTEAGVTSLVKFRNGALPDPARPGHYIEGPANSKIRSEWLGVDPGKTNMATVAHEERSADGSVVSVRHWTLTAGQYYRDSGITRQALATKIWLATVKTQLTALSKVSSKPSSLASYRRFADTVLETYDAMWAEVSKKRWANARFRLYCGKMRVVSSFWAKVKKQAQKLWPDRILALAYGAAGFNGTGTIGCRGVPVSQMRKEAVKQFRPERVVLVDEFRTSRVSSADNTPSETLLDTPPESFRWLRPVKSMAKRSQVRGLMCLTSINNITRFYDRDVSAALNIRRCAVGPGPRPTELCYWTNRPAMPKPGQPGQEWVEIADKPLLLKWQRKQQQ